MERSKEEVLLEELWE
jgi:hypothetical protein